jgi:hypothetical protein
MEIEGTIHNEWNSNFAKTWRTISAYIIFIGVVLFSHGGAHSSLIDFLHLGNWALPLVCVFLLGIIFFAIYSFVDHKQSTTAKIILKDNLITLEPKEKPKTDFPFQQIQNLILLKGGGLEWELSFTYENEIIKYKVIIPSYRSQEIENIMAKWKSEFPTAFK